MCGQARRAEEAHKVEEAARAEAARKAEEECQAELARERAEAERWARVEVVQEAHIEWQRREFKVRKVQEQQRRSQARAEAIVATQGSREATAVPPAAIGLHEVLRAPQQSGGLRSPGELEGDSVCALPSCAQVMLVEYRGEGRGELDGSRERYRDRQSGSAKAGGEKAAAERGKYVAKGSQQAQEGVEHDRGGRSG